MSWYTPLPSVIYRRTQSNWIGTHGVTPTLRYWRAQVGQAFSDNPTLEAVEVVLSGKRTDSQVLQRGSDHAPAGWHVIVASTAGKWGKSRRDFAPEKGGAL